MLYIIGTPIGNLGDISKRAVDALSECDIIFAEDTRTALKLLTHLDIKKQVRSCYKDNEAKAALELITHLRNGENVGLISEAGMPTISDPGSLILKNVIEEGLPYSIIQGPTALIHAIIASSFSGGPFLFYGFLPRKESEKKEVFNNISMAVPVIFYESPERVADTLRAMVDYFEMPIAVIREATKKFEETIFIKSVEDIENINARGEFVIVGKRRREEENAGNVDYNNLLSELKKEGFDKKSSVKVLKILGMSKKVAYDLVEEKFKE